MGTLAACAALLLPTSPRLATAITDNFHLEV